MKYFLAAIALAITPFAATAAVFEYTVNPASQTYFAPGPFSQDSFGAEYDATQLSISGSFDLTGDFYSGFNASSASFSVVAPNGAEYNETSSADVRFRTFEGVDSLVIYQLIDDLTVSDIGFDGLRAASEAEGAITAEILTASSVFIEIVREAGNGDSGLGAFDDGSLTFTSGRLDLPEVSEVPIPAAAPLLLLGLGGLGWAARRKRA